jgi:hypothetical protein
MVVYAGLIIMSIWISLYLAYRAKRTLRNRGTNSFLIAIARIAIILATFLVIYGIVPYSFGIIDNWDAHGNVGFIHIDGFLYLIYGGWLLLYMVLASLFI